MRDKLLDDESDVVSFCDNGHDFFTVIGRVIVRALRLCVGSCGGSRDLVIELTKGGVLFATEVR